MFTTFLPFFAQAIIVQRNATNIVAILLFCRYSQFYIQLAYRATIPFTVKSKNTYFCLSLNKKTGMFALQYTWCDAKFLYISRYTINATNMLPGYSRTRITRYLLSTPTTRQTPPWQYATSSWAAMCQTSVHCHSLANAIGITE